MLNALKLNMLLKKKQATVEYEEKDKDLREYLKNKCENKTFNQTQHNCFSISVQAVLNQDIVTFSRDVHF